MNKRFLVFVVFTLILASGYTSEAQQPTKIPRIGYLYVSQFADSVRYEAFRQGLRELQRESPIASLPSRPS